MTDTKAFHIPLAAPILKVKTSQDYSREADVALSKAIRFRQEAHELITRADELADLRIETGSALDDIQVKYDSFLIGSHENRKLARKMNKLQDKNLRLHDKLMKKAKHARIREYNANH